MIKIISHVTKSQEKNNKKSVKHAENLSYLTPESNLSTEQPEFLEDIQNGKKKPWKEKKQESLLLYESLTRLAQKDYTFEKRAAQVRDCGSNLEFKLFQGLNVKKLHKANFCKLVLCPMCQWRRSMKYYGIVSQIMTQAKQEKFKFLFLTLTIKNPSGPELKKTLDDMKTGWNRLTKDKAFKKAIKGGYIKTIEVTHNLTENTYHPHIHAILAVNPSYFTDKVYISQKKWAELWQQKMKTDYEPRVWVKKVYSTSGSCKEISKYVSKPADMLIKNNQKKTDEIVSTLFPALFSRRLITFGGRLRKIKREQGLNDDDLIHIADEEMNPELDYIILKYHWNFGYKNYVKKQ